MACYPGTVFLHGFRVRSFQPSAVSRPYALAYEIGTVIAGAVIEKAAFLRKAAVQGVCPCICRSGFRIVLKNISCLPICFLSIIYFPHEVLCLKRPVYRT